jgi:MoaA/NifB/PqqE/SkfB family radical SAM enzyme
MNKIEPWLEITTVSKCVIDCSFCPQEAFEKSYHGCKSLSLENFKIALSRVPKNIAIHFSGFSEPFLNPDCINMIEYAHSEGHKIVLYSTLVGLRTEDTKRLKECNPHLVLHLPDNLGNAKIPTTEMYTETLIAVLKTMRIDDISVMNENFVSNERAGLCQGVSERYLRGYFCCPKLLAPQCVMLPNCDVVLCCMDFGLRHCLGNLLEQSFTDILKSSEYKKLCSSRFRMDDDSICRKCVWAVPLHRWYIKSYVKPILYRILRG